MTDVCVSCGRSGPDVVVRDELPLKSAACDECWAAANIEPEPDPEPTTPRRSEPERIDTAAAFAEITDRYQPIRPGPREGSRGTCRYCGAVAAWHPTENGRWLMLELDSFPTGKIAPGHRWRVAGDGTAINLRWANPSETVRVTHFDTCPAQPAPTHSPVLMELWRRRAGHEN